ncbi:MAG: sigma-70 family RNA polymerase sigma factor [Phycisphaerales bacterium]|nr:sigma-70 family RNA polymerase sigma factor [Phycisphaerales bacterium]
MQDGGGETSGSSTEVTRLLALVRDGDEGAVNDLLPLVYGELRARAAAYFRNQRSGHTLQPTALVHEAFLKLVHSPSQNWTDRAHFCAVAATAMRQILTDHARRRASGQRAVGEHAATLMQTPSERSSVDVLAVDEALTKLGIRDKKQAKLVELRFFGGLSIDEVSKILGVSDSTVKRDWRRARAWLLAELKGGYAP